MTYLSTVEAVARGILERIRLGAAELASDVARYDESDEHRQFRLAAAAGARAYAERLAALIDAGEVRDDDLGRHDLVARAGELVGWISAGGVHGIPGDKEAMCQLCAEGVFAFYPAVPGQWVACYRLVAPA